jgi:hypothetical protein
MRRQAFAFGLLFLLALTAGVESAAMSTIVLAVEGMT